MTTTEPRIKKTGFKRFSPPVAPAGESPLLMVESVRGLYVPLFDLTKAHETIVDLQERMHKLVRENKRLRETIETRDLLEVAVMKHAEAIIAEALG